MRKREKDKKLAWVRGLFFPKRSFLNIANGSLSELETPSWNLRSGLSITKILKLMLPKSDMSAQC